MNPLHDPSQNFIARYPHPLDPLFHPATIAVIGAKDDLGSVGRTLMTNLSSNLKLRRLYPVNPKRKEVLGFKAYATIAAIPEPIDLAIIITPAATVPKIISECVSLGVKSVIVISAGFKELGLEGLNLENELLFEAKKGLMPVIGPNCLGVMNPIEGLNATFAKGDALPGNIAFISQSGAMCTAVLDWSRQEHIGFSAFMSIGSMADVNWGTLIDYFGSDPHTESLLLYMETVGDARAFMTAARQVALEKPIIIIKSGRTQAAANAAASHTGALAGSDEVFDAALERAGVLRVNSISELFSMASVLSRQPLPKGPNLTIVTNAGGPAVLATDAAVTNHAQLTVLDDVTIKALNTFLPDAWSHSNPIDILGDASSDRYASTLHIVSKDPKTDGILVALSPQDMTDPTSSARALSEACRNSEKPIIASWMGGESVKSGINILNESKIPTFAYPDDAAKAFGMMWQYTQNLERLYETPIPASQSALPYTVLSAKEQVSKQIETSYSSGRTLLTEFESKQLLTAYGIPIVQTLIATNVDEAIKHAQFIGFPVVLKLHSETITHKSDVGGVKLNLKNDNDVKISYETLLNSLKEKGLESHFHGVTIQKMVSLSGFELILGCSADPQFGPTLLFGMGGQFVEIFKDRALALPPLNNHLALQMMEKTKIFEALKGVRGRKSVDIKALEDLLVNFSRLIIENPRIKECDINPLLVSEDGMIALDARVLLYEESVKDNEIPKPAIRPYPNNYTSTIELKNGLQVNLRMIKPEDEPLISQFHHELSENSVRQRFFEFISLDHRVAHERLIRICFNDYDREWAIVGEISEQYCKKIIGIGRLTKIPGTSKALLKMTIADHYHQQGLGSHLMQLLLKIARNEQIECIYADILSENVGMLKLSKNFGFVFTDGKTSNIIRAQWSFPVSC